MSKKAGATQSRPQPKHQAAQTIAKPSKPQNGRNGSVPVQANKTLQATKPAVNPAEAKATEEARKQARLERQAVNRAAAEKRKRMIRLRNIGITSAALVVLLAVVAYWLISEANKPGQFVPMEPSPHISDVNAQETYSTDPPTSGPHVPQVPQWGVHTEQLQKPLQVHGLEDAGVVVNYQPNIDKATLDRLTALVGGYDTEVILAPYQGLSNPIVLTAWTRIERLDKFDEAAIQRFIQAYRGIDHHKDSGS